MKKSSLFTAHAGQCWTQVERLACRMHTQLSGSIVWHKAPCIPVVLAACSGSYLKTEYNTRKRTEKRRELFGDYFEETTEGSKDF